MMHLQKLTSFLLGLLFFMHALRVSSAYANQGEEGLARRGTNGGVSKVGLLFILYRFVGNQLLIIYSHLIIRLIFSGMN